MNVLPPNVWQWTGPNPGPRVLILGGIHGNEVTGVMLVEQLRRDLDSSALALTAGTLTLAIGNPRAVELGTRGSEPHADLNRCFTGAILAGEGDSYEAQRARELAPFLAGADIAIDLHATNKPSEAFLVVLSDTLRHRELCRFFSCEKILVVPDSVIAGTTDALVDAHGGVGICFESGWVGDLTRVGEMRAAVEGILSRAGMVVAPQTLHDGQVAYQMTEAIALTDCGFAFAPGRGERNFEPFAQGDVLGRHGEDPLVAPYDGVLMFPKVTELWKIGSPVGFLAKRT